MYRAILVGFWLIFVIAPTAFAAGHICDGESATCLSPNDSADYGIELTSTEDGEVVVVVSGPPVVRYVAAGTMPDGGLCWWLSTSAADAVHDPNAGWITQYYQDLIRNNNPQCPYTPADLLLIESTYASISLPTPDVVTTPADIAITGFPLTIDPATGLQTLTATTPPLSSGVTATITATPFDIAIDWGDGSRTSALPTATASHIYELKTCPPDYRIEHPRGHLCHPSLEAYPITVSYRWSGIATAPWGSLDLGIRSSTSTIVRDVDEIIGVVTR